MEEILIVNSTLDMTLDSKALKFFQNSTNMNSTKVHFVTVYSLISIIFLALTSAILVFKFRTKKPKTESDCFLCNECVSNIK